MSVLFSQIRSTTGYSCLRVTTDRDFVMGDVADMMMDGTLCQQCGVYIGHDYASLCKTCALDNGFDQAGNAIDNRRRSRRPMSQSARRHDTHPHSCDGCHRIFKTTESLTQHRGSCSHPIKCGACDQTFKDGHEWAQHYKAQHETIERCS